MTAALLISSPYVILQFGIAVLKISSLMWTGPLKKTKLEIYIISISAIFVVVVVINTIIIVW